MEDILRIKWGNPVVMGDEKAEKPPMVAFRNTDRAIELLYKHISIPNEVIGLHCDVDVDGIGSGYIIHRFLSKLTSASIIPIINQDKIHGIQQKHVEYFKSRKLDFLVIVDSSSNELDIIKQFKCDVLVVDHHELNHSDLCGKTNDGHNYVIVNNTVDNVPMTLGNIQFEKYVADDRMSCGLVIYELLRIYCELYGLEHMLENMMLYQWAGVTLFTDSITLNTPRNQWYIENTVHSLDTEPTLSILTHQLNKFRTSLDKSLICYTIGPVLNKAIRAGFAGNALDIVLRKPNEVQGLTIYKENQENAISEGSKNIVITESYVAKDITNTNIPKTYTGVIASKLLGEHKKNAIVYTVSNGIVEGSFRGRVSGADYRSYINDYADDTEANGHKGAFGFKCPVSKLDTVMSNLVSLESNIDNTPFLTAGRLNNTNPGRYQINDINEFKRLGNLFRLGMGNSKVNSDEQLFITVSSMDAVLAEQKGKLFIYDILGIQCKAFEPITEPIINIYAEYSKQLECYVK